MRNAGVGGPAAFLSRRIGGRMEVGRGEFMGRHLVLFVVLLLMLGGNVAVAQPGNEIDACVNGQTGQLRIVDDPDDCRRYEDHLSWNQVGPQGPQGPEGPQGPPGDVAAHDHDSEYVNADGDTMTGPLAVGVLTLSGTSVTSVSDDTTLADDSSSALVTEHAVKGYVDNAVQEESSTFTLVTIPDADVTANTFSLELETTGGVSVGSAVGRWVVTTGGDLYDILIRLPEGDITATGLLSSGNAIEYVVTGGTAGFLDARGEIEDVVTSEDPFLTSMTFRLTGASANY